MIYEIRNLSKLKLFVTDRKKIGKCATLKEVDVDFTRNGYVFAIIIIEY